ncbi:phage tail protein [Azotobacter beijerinckii]|uniref:phage tail protein n=1 Tax=Azotobacter beijerinckii TaxID=170623 RepID=UPI0029541275|nr:phage tail protein [Azotobacter beijerinckii]MDV7209885.1 phage tail protein [Azotobacter beijerinckii]
MSAVQIRGRKAGASSPRQPKEAPDDIQSTAYAKILLALGEGEFAGGLTAKDIYLDGTPIEAADGTQNFSGVSWEFRPGTVEQAHIAGMPSIENEIAVGVELRSDTPWVRAVTNTQLSAVRIRLGWPTLQQQKDNGDIVGYVIDYALDVATDGGAYQQVATYTVSGKTTSTYERTHRVDLPAATSGWQVRMRRLTANQDNNRIADTMRVAALTEVIDSKLRYPNTALLFVELDASQFQNIPQIAVETRGRVVRVPSTYNPTTRAYTGVWDGTFQWAWTDNPAWIWYDIVLSERFGLGRRIGAAQVDKWELYQIAQYCDQLVSDGQGGMEPRFTCNVYFQSRTEAWTVLRDLSAIFRGMSYWANSQMVAMADMPRDIDYVYTRANVVDGRFTYASASEKTRYSQALVSYDNPDNGYQSEVEPVSDNALVRRYGVNQLELTAIGCTRRSEANRRGRWALLTNRRDRTVSFRVGLDGQIPLPGRIIGVADELLAGRPLGGRIAAVSSLQITLDRDTQVLPGDRLVLNLPSGAAEGRTVANVVGRVVTVTTEYSETPSVQAQWAIDASDLVIQQYRVMGIVRPEPGLYEITAIQHDPGKYAAVDTGARLEDLPISVIPPGVQAPPTGVTIDSYTSVDQGIAITTMRVSWASAVGAVAYTAEWRKDSGDWVSVPRTSALGFEVRGIYAGRYLVRVRAINVMDVASALAYSAETELTGKTGAPPAVAYLTAAPLVFGIRLDWGFPDGAEDTQRTEIQYNTTQTEAGVLHLGDYAYPTNSHTLTGLAAAITLHFRARLVDRTGNIGPWSDWVMGQSSTDATEILDYLADQISETELAQQLVERIDLIDGPAGLPGSVNERLNQATSALQEQIDTVAEQAGAIEYDPDSTYVEGDTVRSGKRLYQAVQDVPANNSPPNATYWLDIGQVVSDSNGLAARVTQTETRLDAAEDELIAQASTLDGVQSTLNGKADASAVTALATRVSAAEDEITSQGSAITGLQNTVAGKADASAVTALTTRVAEAEDEISSQSGAITSLQSSVANKAEASAVTALDTRVTETEEDIQAVSEKTDGVYAQVNPPMAGSTTQMAGSTTVMAGVWSIQSAAASDTLAVARRVDQAEVSIGSVSAAVQSETEARADAVSALSVRVDTVQAVAGSNSAAIQQTSEALAALDGELSAMWSVKLGITQDGQYYAAGMGIGIENTPEGMQSQILFQADRFAVINVENGQISSPFVIQGGQVFINSAVIGDGTIGMAKIATALQSTNYVAGQTGWRLDKDGTFEINGSLAGQGRTLINNSGVYVYDSNNTLRVELGALS